MKSDIPDFNLSTGFGWFAVLKPHQQKHPGRKVFFDIAQVNSRVRVTIGLDNADSFRAWVSNAAGQQFETPPIPKDRFWDRFVIAGCEIVPRSPSEALCKVVIGDANTETVIPGSLGSQGRALASLGANQEGQESAAFDLAELVQLGAPISQSDREKLYSYFRQKYDI